MNRKVYLILKKSGHTPAKAGEIALDWERGDPWARGWVRMWIKMMAKGAAQCS